ncbi:hypothetical protein IMCC1989_2017 [gamma proteobacterium IMCC1989]|nr:hypothetical protein IMCC1989_2017 [gamma proteobacterium IMCC1989]
MTNKVENPIAARKSLIAHAELSTQPLIGKETKVHEALSATPVK